MPHRLHPQIAEEVDAVEGYGDCWPQDRPFPFTPEECKALVMGYVVRPKAPITLEDVDRLPGMWEGGPQGVVLHRK